MLEVPVTGFCEVVIATGFTKASFSTVWDIIYTPLWRLRVGSVFLENLRINKRKWQARRWLRFLFL